MQRLERRLVLVSSFFLKELEALLRQPLLVLSFIVGPMVLLGLFGIGYRGQDDQLTAILVLPVDSDLSNDPAAFKKLFTYAMTVTEVTRDRQVADTGLLARRADVALVVPDNIHPTLRAGRHPQFQVFYNQVDPLKASWIPFLSSLAVQDLNLRVSTRLVGSIEQRIAEAAKSADEIHGESESLDAALQRHDREGSQNALTSLRRSLASAGPASALLLVSLAGQHVSSMDALAPELATIEAELALGQVGTPEQIDFAQRLTAAAGDAARRAHELADIPADVITAPFEVQATNTVRVQASVIAFYAPAVVALLLQHIAISLVSLSMVRERLLGAMEIYRVAPVGMGDLMLGKSLSYGVILGVLATILVFVIVRFIQVPLIGPVGWVVAVLGLLLFASLGVGFLLATVARSEMQAVQLAMLVFLGSTIFGDFFLPIDELSGPVRAVSYVFPMTYATMALRDVMLRGVAPSTLALVGPLMLGLVSFAIAAFSIRREMATA